MNCPLIIRILFLTALLSTPFFAVPADNYAKGVRKESCKLYELELPENWISEDPIDASGMPPTRGALLYDDAGGETKCHLSHQSWKFFDINHIDDAQSCHIESYILPSGAKPNIKLVRRKACLPPQYPSSKWIKIEGCYMKSMEVRNEGWKVTPKGLKQLFTDDRVILVVREGREYVHLLEICVPAKRYRSDENYRRMVDSIWKNWKLKK